MKKKKLVFLAFATIAIALLLEAGILKYVNDSNTYRMSKVLLDRVITVLNKNDDSENGLIESLKDDYIVRAKAVSYIIDAKPQVEYDVEELQKIADLILVDEIHLFDKNGYIYSGTLPKYYGFSFDSGEQMEYFKPMLKNKNLTMCQDVTPNTAEGKELMYAITWNEAGTRMIQIGIEPKRLLKELKQNEISAVVSDMPVYKGIEIFVADSQTKIVKGATDSRQIGVKLEGLVVSSDKKSGETDVRLIRIGGKRCKCLLSQYDDYIVAVTIDSSFYRQGNIFCGSHSWRVSCIGFLLYVLHAFKVYEKKKICVVTNPASNLKLASGIAPVKTYLEKGIPVAIGTDGPASNNCLDMFKEMFLVTGLQKVVHNDPEAVPAADVLKMATVNGAYAMGLDNCDILAEGKYADLIMIDLMQPNNAADTKILEKKCCVQRQ